MPVEGVVIDPLDSHALQLDSYESDSFSFNSCSGIKNRYK